MSDGDYYQEAIRAIERAEYWHQQTRLALERELAEARKELAQLREWHAAASKVMSDYVRDATPVIAEVEAAFRAGFRCLLEAPESSHEEDAAWSRYQQERKA